MKIKKSLFFIVQLLVIFGMIITATLFLTKNKINEEILPATAGETTQDEAEKISIYKIGIVQYSDSIDQNEAYEGFIDGLRNAGYEKGKNIIIEYGIAHDDNDSCKRIIDEYISAKYDLIYTIGSQAAKTAYDSTKEIPIVFGGIQDPEEDGLVKSNEKPQTNVTGVSDYTPCFEQAGLIKELFPNAKTVGALYNEADESSLLQVTVTEMEATGDTLNLEYKKYPIENSDEIKSVLDSIFNETDVMYLPIDEMTNNSIGTIVEKAKENKFPIIAGNKDMVISGCLATYTVNYISIGHESANMALEILVNNADPAQMPVQYKHDCQLIINKETSKTLSLSLSEQIKNKALFV